SLLRRKRPRTRARSAGRAHALQQARFRTRLAAAHSAAKQSKTRSMSTTKVRLAQRARKAPLQAPRVGFVSLGCPKALVDSEQIVTQLKAEGYDIAPTYDGAAMVVVN